MSRWIPLLLLMGLCLALPAPDAAMAATPADVTVFAAASTTNALGDIAELFAARGRGKVVCSFASSSTLAKQIEQGAPAQVFISADQKWMNWMEERRLIEPGSRRDLLGNRLVIIAPRASQADLNFGTGRDLGRELLLALGDGRLALGDPDHVPVGIYAKHSLTQFGAWAALEPRLARAADVRAALTLVERGEAPLGIVYSTDAAVTAKVRVVAVFPESSHPPIVYPACLVVGQATPQGRAFLEFLGSPEARKVFEKYGFAVK